MNTSRFTFILAAGIFMEDIITVICGSRNVWFMFWFEETEFCWNHLDYYWTENDNSCSAFSAESYQEAQCFNIFFNITPFNLEGLQQANVWKEKKKITSISPTAYKFCLIWIRQAARQKEELSSCQTKLFISRHFSLFPHHSWATLTSGPGWKVPHSRSDSC